MSGETVSYYGWCATYCDQALDGEIPVHGADPAVHGRWCRSISVGADGIAPDGQPRTVYVEANSEYINGEMPADRVPLHNKLKNVVGLYLHGSDDPDIALTPGEARQLAAALVYFADVASRIDQPAPRLPR
ncbi:hypothetical protein MYK68_04115 [Gordonia sp. PP30]|uniref:hypothetical protein n=1 Tax=Gordonia sp. PP30 TaxID=2935861 RepID=UPI001FFFF3E3|nr:hypothetical protein [Gordonia sp. PP30]UQE75805.1 hypothetical protein MYK68_04115 [Gordonia sp. PP30]